MKDQSTKRKENALLARTFGKTKKKDDNSRGRGRGWGRGISYSKGWGRSYHHYENGDEEDKKPRDKSKVICHKCKKVKYYAN